MFARRARPLACVITAFSLAALHAAAFADSDSDRERDRSKDRTVTVDCAAGDTIARALTRGDDRKSLTILISGTCSENVVINRSDVKLAAAAPGATVSGSDTTLDTIRVTGSRVTIDGITVTGGLNGILADGAAGLIVQNSVVQGTGRTGIISARGASAIVDNVVVQNNPRDGIAIESGSADVINSQITLNTRMGVGVFNAGSARIGVDNANNAAGSVITANGVNGIHVVFSASAFIGMNQINGNGTVDPTGNGINISNASADIVGGNTISGNSGSGINLRMASALIGDARFGLTTVNTITSNGNPTQLAGISAFLGSSVSIRDAIVSQNVGFGVLATTRSTIQILSSTITNNVAFAPGTGDGIRVSLGSALSASAPVGTVTGNAGFGLQCTDPESSVVNTASLGIGANGLGGVSPGCTGF
jgi:hypothetical protein